MKYQIIAALIILLVGCKAETSEDQVTVAVEDAVLEEVTEVDTEVIANPVLDTEEVDSFFLLTERNAGLFEVGSSSEEIEAIASGDYDVQLERVDRVIEGMSSPAIAVFIDGTKALLIEVHEGDGIVYRIEVNSEAFRTASGVGVGSTYQELEANYTIDGIYWGDGGNPVAIAEADGFSFLLEPGDWWQDGDVIAEVPFDTKITKMFLW